MEIQKIQKLTEEWDIVTDIVIRFENPGYSKIRKLFEETYEILDKYCVKELVPKEITGLLLGVRDFGWWVGDLDDTPLHHRYQEIISVIFDLNIYFLTRDGNTDAIKDAIERIIE